LKLPKAEKAESTTAIDPEESYVSTDRGHLGRRMERGEKYEMGIDSNHSSHEALKEKRLMDRRDYEARTCSNDNIP
jgi:hypothetical protein